MDRQSGVAEAFRRGAAAAGALLAFLTLAGAAPAAEVSVGVESSMTKVHRDPAHNIPPLSERALPESMSLEGARGERAHGQVLVVAGPADVSGVTWEARPLVGPDGATIPLSVQVVGFLKTEKGPYDVDHVGWWPDPLLSHLTTVDVPARFCQPLWVTALIPRNAPSGVYAGTVEIRAGDDARGVPVNLRVRNVAIPRMRHLRVAGTYEEGTGPMMYGDGWTEEMKWRCRQFVLDHRLNVTGLYQFSMPMMMLTKNESVEDFRRLREAGQNVFIVSDWANGRTWTQEQFETVDATLSRAREAGIPDDHLWFYGYDEAAEDRRPDMIADARVIKARYPTIGIMTTAGIWYPSNHRWDDLGARDELSTLVDAWVPVYSYYEEADLGEGPWRSITDSIEAARGRGQEVWWYFSCVPRHPYPHWFVEYPAIEARLLMGVMPWKHQPQGFLYYTFNRLNWDDPRGPQNRGNPINDGPLCKWSPDSLGGNVNGDGCLFYYGTDGLVSTIRLENLTDGLEDYEYFWVLNDLVGKLERSTLVRSTEGRAALIEARERLAAPGALVRSLRDFTRDPAALSRALSAVADSIERIQALGIEQTKDE